MIEVKKELLRQNSLRGNVAGRLLELRRIERYDSSEAKYPLARGGALYIDSLKGISHFFDHVRRIAGSSTVLDIGAGKTSGIYELSSSRFGQNLNFEATVLTQRSRPKNKTDKDRIRVHVTSSEVLRGIPSRSIAGVLAVNSIAYSVFPEMAVKGIDRVLVPGGAFKGVFRHSIDPEGRWGLKLAGDFLKTFADLGYDCGLSPRPDNGVLLAIKPTDYRTDYSAQEILDRDLNTKLYQVEEFCQNSKSWG